MTAVSKREALDALNKARTKAQLAHKRWEESYLNSGEGSQVDRDAAKLHYDRCVAEFEQAINDAAPYETSGDDD